MNIEQHRNYWVDSAQHDLETAEALFDSAKYDWCLFIGHIVLEKILKAVFVINNDNSVPPKTHNLIKLAELSKVVLTNEQLLFLNTVNGFNLEVRYPEYKNEFYKICTKEYTEKYFNKIKDYYKWQKYQIK